MNLKPEILKEPNQSALFQSAIKCLLVSLDILI